MTGPRRTRCGRSRCTNQATHVITAGGPAGTGNDYKMAVTCPQHVEPTRRWASSVGTPTIRPLDGVNPEPDQPALFDLPAGNP